MNTPRMALLAAACLAATLVGWAPALTHAGEFRIQSAV